MKFNFIVAQSNIYSTLFIIQQGSDAMFSLNQ